MPEIPRLLAVSDRRRLELDAWPGWCSTLAAAGVDGLQVRERDLDDGELLALASAARRAFPAPGRLLVSRRLDVALAAGADGVHLPASGLPVDAVRRAVAGRLLVGRSTHTVEEIRQAKEMGADYVIFGPVFDTPSKRGVLAPRGLDWLGEAVAVGLPVVAIGGIEEGNLASVIARGAAGVAAIRAFSTAESAAAMVAASRGAHR